MYYSTRHYERIQLQIKKQQRKTLQGIATTALLIIAAIATADTIKNLIQIAAYHCK